jgi:FkbM family methyltransferase
MSFISYAQNFEDVMLWRALKHIELGFYIDVGAWSPDTDSVTRTFYENGWHGINVEPNPEFHGQLNSRRPRDTNLQVAMGEAEGIMAMNFLTNSGLSTLDDSIAKKHQAAGWEASRREVEVKTLAAIWQQHVPNDQPVHFLKVDVEGLEEAVLRGNDWARYRPWVVVVEATLPMSQVESHADWEPILLDAGYKFAYADGLNRFYVAEEHADLVPAFKYPPNVFDEFMLANKQESEARAQQAEANAHDADERTAKAVEAINTLTRHAEFQGRQLHEVTEKAQTLQQQLNEVSTHTAADQARVELLQSQLRQAEQKVGSLERELADSRLQAEEKITAEKTRMEELTAQLSEKDRALEAKHSELEQLHAHSRWLQNEWDAAKAKIDELNHSSHHWWTVADGLNHELQSVYRSRSWIITWPLRKLMQLLGWLFQFPIQVVVGLVRLPKRAARWVLARVIAFVLRREGLKHRARRWLYRHPRLEAHLRAFARARGFIQGPVAASSHLVETKVSAGARQEVNDWPGDAHLSETLTPRARQIYADLKTAIEKNKQEAA